MHRRRPCRPGGNLLLATVIALSCLMAPAMPATAQDPPAQEAQVQAAQALLILWNQAQTLIRQGSPREAIPILERLVSIAPGQERLRLELARAYYLVEDDEKARFHFEQSLGGNLTDETRRAALSYLDGINRRRNWEGSLSFAIVPETNAGRVTGADSIEFFGLNWSLDQQPERDIGLHANARLTYFPRLSRDVSGRISVSANGRIYRDNSNLNDVRLGIETGLVRRADGDREMGAGVSLARRWVGNDPFSTEPGLYATFNTRAGNRTRLNFRADVTRLKHDRNTQRDGTRARIHVGAHHVLSPRLALRGHAFATAVPAQTALQSSNEVGLGVGVTRAFEGGLVASLDFSVLTHERLGVNAGFGVARKDTQGSVTARFLHRDFNYNGFAPRLELGYERRNSTIAIHDYSNFSVSIGVTRQF